MTHPVTIFVDFVAEIAGLVYSTAENTGEMAVIPCRCLAFSIQRFLTDEAIGGGFVPLLCVVIPNHVDIVFDHGHNIIVQVSLQ